MSTLRRQDMRDKICDLLAENNVTPEQGHRILVDLVWCAWAIRNGKDPSSSYRVLFHKFVDGILEATRDDDPTTQS